MMNPRDMHSRKLIEVIEQIPLPKDKMVLAEVYLMQEAGDEVLEQFDFQDLSEIEGGKSAKVFYELTRKGRKEEARRLFKLLFAIGWSTCCHMLGRPDYWRGGQGSGSLCPGDRHAAVPAKRAGNKPSDRAGRQ